MNTTDAIRTRRTLKVLADPKQPWPPVDDSTAEVVRELMEVAGHAPYHYHADSSHRSGPLNSPVPWRFHVLTSSACRKMIGWSEDAGIAIGKMNNMFAAASACIVATWLPDPDENATAFQAFDPNRRNMEHIAAASAAVQNLLLVATEKSFETYWSSGGYLRNEVAFDHLKIDHGEILLGSIFLFPAEVGDAITKPGAHRESRGPLESWSRTIEI